MLPNQAAKPCVHIGFEVANRMKSKEHYEQHKKERNSCFHRTFLQLFVIVLYVCESRKKLYPDQSLDKDLIGK